MGSRHEIDSHAKGSTHAARRVLLIDNYDSFTYNLAQYLRELGAKVVVRKNNALDLQGVLAENPTHIVLSPGPGRPEHSGVCRDICAELGLAIKVPLLGVCLGHQTLCASFGASVVSAPRLMHGRCSQVSHDGTGIFAGIPAPFSAMRYHSLMVAEASLPGDLLACAHVADPNFATPELMAVRHRTLPVFGVQFHPESIGSQWGHELLRNFLQI